MNGIIDKMNCKKCKRIGSLTIRKEHVYCNDCFMTNINHKFRACIGKNKILSSNEKVLICVTGGQSSTVLMDLVFNGLSQENHKKLRISPIFLHLTGFGKKDDLKAAEIVINQCRKYNFNVYVVNICKFHLQGGNTLPNVNCLSEISNYTENDLRTNLNDILCKMTPTTKSDVETKIKHDNFIRIAKELKCNYVFTAETTTTLAVNLLSNLSIGRGSQVEDDIGFCDKRDKNIKVLRPMKDITEEELQHYIKIRDLIHISVKDIKFNSLQSVIKHFVKDLHENFPATVSTICKTADKIGCLEQTEKRCQFCKSSFNVKRNKITAVDATNFSRTMSNFLPSNNTTSTMSTLQMSTDDSTVNLSMFPFLDDHFCYCCSRNYLEGGFEDISQIVNNIVD
ncbi:cytoplasmic tRNA 2-thiolation protein 2 [Battus philenor]|uniref:cytoplasmic tRNA 2-thiolation protein 2 n=1 Tax=Battus philenor TaxID=42288 RepID=UPI0035D09B84